MRRYHRLYTPNPLPGTIQRHGAVNASINPGSRLPNLGKPSGGRRRRNPPETYAVPDWFSASGDPSQQDFDITEAIDAIAARSVVIAPAEKRKRAHGSWETRDWKGTQLYPASVLYIPPGKDSSEAGRHPSARRKGAPDGKVYSGHPTQWTYVLFDNNVPPRAITYDSGEIIVGHYPSYTAAATAAAKDLASWAEGAIQRFIREVSGRSGEVGASRPANLPTESEIREIEPHFQLARFSTFEDPILGGFRGKSTVAVREAPGSHGGDVMIHTWAEPEPGGARAFYSQVFVRDASGESRPYGGREVIRSEEGRLDAEIKADKLAEQALRDLGRSPNPGRAVTPVLSGSKTAVRNAADFMGSYVAAQREYERNPRMRKRMETGCGRYFSGMNRRKNPILGKSKSQIKVDAAELRPEDDMMLGQFVIPKNSADAARMGYNFGVLAGIQRCGPKDILARRQFQTELTNQLVDMVSKNITDLVGGARGREIVGTVVS